MFKTPGNVFYMQIFHNLAVLDIHFNSYYTLTPNLNAKCFTAQYFNGLMVKGTYLLKEGSKKPT